MGDVKKLLIRSDWEPSKFGNLCPKAWASPSLQAVPSFFSLCAFPFQNKFLPLALVGSPSCVLRIACLISLAPRHTAASTASFPAVWTCWARNSSQQRCSFSLLKNKTLYLMPSLSAPSLERLIAVSPGLIYIFSSTHAILNVLDSWDKTEMWISNHSNEGKNTGREWESHLLQGCDILSVAHRPRTSGMI